VRYCQNCGRQIACIRTNVFGHTNSVVKRSDVSGECDEKLMSAEKDAD
jgi:hypothetical protein